MVELIELVEKFFKSYKPFTIFIFFLLILVVVINLKLSVMFFRRKLMVEGALFSIKSFVFALIFKVVAIDFKGELK